MAVQSGSGNQRKATTDGTEYTDEQIVGLTLARGLARGDKKRRVSIRENPRNPWRETFPKMNDSET
jgi:hypothetical protein